VHNQGMNKPEEDDQTLIVCEIPLPDQFKISPEAGAQPSDTLDSEVI